MSAWSVLAPSPLLREKAPQVWRCHGHARLFRKVTPDNSIASSGVRFLSFIHLAPNKEHQLCVRTRKQATYISSSTFFVLYTAS